MGFRGDESLFVPITLLCDFVKLGKTHIFPSGGPILIIQKPKITFSDVLNSSKGARGQFDNIWWVFKVIKADLSP